MLDTSLLPPTLGIEVKKAEKVLDKLRRHELYYSDFSILECLWAISSLKKEKFEQEIFEVGMKSIFEGYIRAKINTEIILKAFELNIEHNDKVIEKIC